jgi:site-specific recombinase XerD
MTKFRDCLNQYISTRRALGSSFYEPAKSLAHFVDFLEHERAESITSELALRWAMQSGQVQRATWARRLGHVRGFARWMVAIDARTEVPAPRLLSSRRRRNPPHIYTQKEIEDLLHKASELPSTTGMRALTYSTLIGLLVATGLRPSEAISLDNKDVDLSDGILSIRDSKFGKSRFVPIHESTHVALKNYVYERDKICSRRTDDAFLISEYGKRLVACSVRAMFAKLSRETGLRATWSDGRRGLGPRLQDFRHTFATSRMVQWYREGKDVSRELPKLSTYLGHVEVGLTYWYVEAVPELLEQAAKYLDQTKGVGDRL